MRALLSRAFAPVLTGGLDQHQLSAGCQIGSLLPAVTHPLKVPFHTWALELTFVFVDRHWREQVSLASLPLRPSPPRLPAPRGCQGGKQAEGPRHSCH